jgi:transcription initiation factor TFIID TATA-box-binding protein
MAKKEKSPKAKAKKPEVYTKTENVVVSASLNRELPLERLAARLENADYNPETFPGLILKIESPKANALLFSSGKVICTGARNLKEAKAAIAVIVKKIEGIGLKVGKVPDVEIQNVVASGSVGGKLNLNEIIMKFENTEYDPEQFPGLVYKPANTHITFLLFGTGKVVITGAKSEKETKEVIWALREELLKAGELREE